MGLRYRQPGVIQTGRYTAKLNFPIDPARLPTSMTLREGMVQYKIVATLPRKFPNRNLVVEQLVYVVNTNLPSPYYPEKMIGENPSLEGQLYNPVRWTAPVAFSTKLVDEFSYKQIKSRPPPTHLCEIPTTAFFAGETVPIAISTLLDPPTPARPKAGKDGKKRNRFLNLIINGPSLEEPEVLNWPNTYNLVPGVISIRLEQIIVYKDHGGEAALPEIREFEISFNMPPTLEGENPNQGFMTIFQVILPSLADQLDYLKPSMGCKALDIRHSLKVNLKFKEVTHKLRVPITISAPTHPGRPIPDRFQAVDWAGLLAVPKGMEPRALLPASFAQMGKVKGMANVAFNTLQASQITKWSALPWNGMAM